MKNAENGKTAAARISGKTILYVDCRPEAGIERRRLAGIRRYAATRGWRVETLEHADCSPETLREALVTLHLVGCVAECWSKKGTFLPAAFGNVPVVYFGPPEEPEWRGALRVESDDAAVAGMAFRELSAGRPSAFTVVSFWMERRWQRERIDAFRDCCRKAGLDCPLAFFPECSAKRGSVPTPRLIEWAASLPPHCAVFAVDDICAYIVADAMLKAGRAFPHTVTLVGADGTTPRQPEDKQIAPMVSSVVLDHEYAGYLAAKMIGETFSHRITESQRNDHTDLLTPHGVRDAGNVSRVSGEPIRVTNMGASVLSAAKTATFPPLLVDRRRSTRGRGRCEPRILEAMEMIRCEACEGLTAASLAARFPGSRRLFEIRFREAAGHSALDEILNVRLARAVELLAHTDTSIAAVANFCGFERMGSFWKTFRKRIGVSPLAFRNDRKR